MIDTKEDANSEAKSYAQVPRGPFIWTVLDDDIGINMLEDDDEGRMW